MQHRDAGRLRRSLSPLHCEVLPSLALLLPGVCTSSTFGTLSLSLLYASFHSGLTSLGPHSHSLIPEPWALSSFGLPSSEALGICFLAARGCTLIHLYHRKQKTSLTSHLFHRWESNSLLNDCPEPTIQRGRIYSAAKERGALLQRRYIRSWNLFSLPC